jgi:hypothetical protein
MSRTSNKNSTSGVATEQKRARMQNAETSTAVSKDTEATQVLTRDSAAIDDDQFDFTIHQERLFDDKIAEPLAVRAVIGLILKLSRANTPLSDAERGFLTDFSKASDRGRFIENSFLRPAIDGKTLKTYTYRMPDGDEDAGWVSLHRFFSMYVVNHRQYGEGEDDYGPFARRKDANAAFDSVVTFSTPLP